MSASAAHGTALQLTTLIGSGATRDCYVMPGEPHLCIKVMRPGKSPALLVRELEVYEHLKPLLGDYLVPVYPPLRETTQGLGMVQELLKNEDGSTCRPVWDFQGETMLPEIRTALADFYRTCVTQHLFFYDVNPLNFLIQYQGGRLHLRYSDLKSYNRYKSWIYLHAERIIPALAERIMRRRFLRLLTRLGIAPEERERMVQVPGCREI